MSFVKEYQDDLTKIKEALDYNPETGVFTWKTDRPADHFKNQMAHRVWKTRFSGKVAGYSKQKGVNTNYITIRVFHKLYLAHRLAWAFVHDKWPDYEVDHINGDGLDNSISNLRDVPKEVNGKNSNRKSNNTSGVNGVWWHKQGLKWCAEGHYTEEGVHKKKYLGLFETIEEAEKARLNWQESHGGFSDRHGK